MTTRVPFTVGSNRQWWTAWMPHVEDEGCATGEVLPLGRFARTADVFSTRPKADGHEGGTQ